MISLGWPQIIYLTLALIGVGVEIARNGEPKTGKHNATSSLIATVVILSLLWWGGFFG